MTDVFVDRYRQVEDDKWEWVAEVEKFDTDNDFHINPDDLSTEMQNFSRKMIHYADVHAELKAEVLRKKKEVDYVWALKAQQIRQEAAEAGNKLTQSMVEEAVILDATYQATLQRYFISEKYFNLLNNWWNAMNKKADMLNALAWQKGRELKMLGQGY